MGIEPKEELSGARSADELTYLIRHSATAGLLEEDDATLLDRTLRFAGYDAADVTTPRVHMVTAHVDDTAQRIIEICSSSGFSRLPVIDEDSDDVVGFVHVKHAFGVPPEERETTRATDLMSEPVRVPETVGADKLLNLLRSEGMQIAIVSDEYGGTAGLVTLEDLVEEIVGELYDEHDRSSLGMTKRGRSTYFDASWRPDELKDRTGIVVPEHDDWETVAGFVTTALERVAEVGDEVRIDGGRLRVSRMDNSRIVRLRFLPDREPRPDEVTAEADSNGDRTKETRR
jgi:CBS domain containing-hemolysin-like protein